MCKVLALPHLLVAAALVASCRETVPAGPQPEWPEPKPPAGPATLLWATEVHNGDGYGHGITPQALTLDDGREVIAVLHDGDSANWLYHLDTASGAVIDSFVVDAPGFGIGNTKDIVRGPNRIGDDYIADIDSWNFRVSLRTGEVKWLWQRTVGIGYIPPDTSALFQYNYVDWGDAPRLLELDLDAGTVVDSFDLHAYLGIRPDDHRVGFGSVVTTEVPDAPDDKIVIASNSYFTVDSGAYARNWLQAIRWSDKEVLWRRRLEEEVWLLGNAPVIHGDLMIRPFRDTIRAISISTGETVWKYTPWDDDDENRATRHFTAAPGLISEENWLYFGASYNYAMCLDAETGREIWKHRNGFAQATGDGFSLSSDGLLFRTEYNGQYIFVHDRYTGEQLAALRRPTANGTIWHGVHYDQTTRRVYGYDGARVFCYQLNFEPPG